MDIPLHPLIGQSQLLGLGLVAALPLTLFLSRRTQLGWARGIVALCLTFAGAAVGARLWALGFDPDAVLQPFNPVSAGYASAGAIVGGVPAAVLFAHIASVRIVALLDALIAPGLLILGLTRLGCLFEGCHVGRPTQGWGLRYAAGTRVWTEALARGDIGSGDLVSQTLHAFPVYACIAALLGALIAIVMAGRGIYGGGLIGALVYFMFRIPAEVFRDGQGTTTNIMVSLLGCVVVTLFWRFRGSSREP